MAKSTHTPNEFFRPLVTGWLGKIQLARQARQPWADCAKECMAFFSEATGFMWKPEYGGRFWSNSMEAPRFQLTLAKAFELVAIFGPTLWSNVPHRSVSPKRQLFVSPERFSALFPQPQQPQEQPPPGTPPEVVQQFQQYQQQMQQQQQQQMQQMYQQMMQKELERTEQQKVTAELMELWLNYTPIEQPNGGLEAHGEMAITEALVKGRSCLWARPYKMPGSQRTLTGCFWKTVDDLFIDPDATSLDDAQWIASRWVQPWYVVEERFNLPTGSLKGMASLESSMSEGARMDDPLANARRASGQTADMIEYYEIWSKAGPGAKLTGMDSDIGQHLEKTVGKYAYIVVAPSVPYPLNAPSGKARAADDLAVQAMYSWPVPTWTDNRWPVAMLDFYPVPGKVWPLPPLSPGLGELKFLNVMISHLCSRIWSSSRDFIAVAKNAVSDLRKTLENGGDLAIIEWNKQLHGTIQDNISFLQQPQVNMDVWRIIEAVSDIFDRRVGLTDLLYGLNPGGTNPRTAEEVSAKRQMVSVRPEKMAKTVEAWSTQAASLEAFCTRFFVDGTSVEPLIGPFGRQLWEKFVMSTDVEAVVREMNYTVAAGSARRPNKDRDVANVSQFAQVFGPMVLPIVQATGNVQPINAMIEKWGKSADMDVSDMLLSPPPPPPNQDAMMQQQMEMQQKQMEMQQQMQQTKMQFDQQVHQQELGQDQQVHQQEMEQDKAEAALKMQLEMAKAQIKGQVDIQKAQQQGEIQRQQAEQQAQIQERQATVQLARQAAAPLGPPANSPTSKNGRKQPSAA